MRWLQLLLMDGIVKALRPALREWLFGRVLYLSDDDFRRLSGGKQEVEILMRKFYAIMRTEIAQNYDRLERELLERIR